MLTYDAICNIIKVSRERQIYGQAQKGELMEDEMNMAEMFKAVTEENQTRKILEILNESKDLDEAKEKVKALLNN